MSEQVLLARALLSRVAEPASIPVWGAVRERGAVRVAAEVCRLAQAVRLGDIESFTREEQELATATAARVDDADPGADLEIAARHGVRLVVPESEQWPHFTLSALEKAGERRLQTWKAGKRGLAEYGEPIPPLALWVRGHGDLATLGTQSVGIVGSRASTAYGNHVAGELASGLARRDFTVVSGGAHGIDAAAHRGALAVGAPTVIVSAGGLDRPYPSSNAALFDRAAAQGLLVSESPPGSAPRRHRFLTRNRLIASFSTGTVVVEAAARSGAMNTAGHARRLGRPVMAVPGPVTSTMSAGCHVLLAQPDEPAVVVTSVPDVVRVIGPLGDATADEGDEPQRGTTLQRMVDELDLATRLVFDGMPARRTVRPDDLVRVTGLPLPTVLGALPDLETRGLVVADGAGHRLAPRERPGIEH